MHLDLRSLMEWAASCMKSSLGGLLIESSHPEDAEVGLGSLILTA